MGDEYTLSFRVDAKEDVENAFKALPSFDRVYELHGRRVFEFRAETNAGEMPCASASVTDDGIYFCDNGPGAEILEELREILSGRFGAVTCNEA